MVDYIADNDNWNDTFELLHKPEGVLSRLYILMLKIRYIIITGISALCRKEANLISLFQEAQNILSCIQAPMKSLFLYDYFLLKLSPFFLKY